MAWFKPKPIEPIVAAATVLSPKPATPTPTGAGVFDCGQLKTDSRQRDAFFYAQSTGELAGVIQWLRNNLTRVRLTIVDVDENGDPGAETADPTALGLFGALASPAVQADLLSTMGAQIFIAGESYAIGEITDTTDPNAEVDTWSTASSEELKDGATRGTYRIDRGLGDVRDLAPDTFVIRVYKPSAFKQNIPDSAVMSALPTLRLMRVLDEYQLTVLESRLVGAGIIAFPSEISWPSSAAEVPGTAGGFMEDVQEAMAASIKDATHASRHVPITLNAPGDAIAQIKHFTFASEVTAVVAELRDKATKRLASELDVPGEVLTGELGNHWTAHLTDAQSIRSHIEPLVILICNALTQGYVRVFGTTPGFDSTRFAIWFDSSELTLSSNRAQDAKDLFDRGAIDARVLRESAGFTDADAPTDVHDQAFDLGLALVEKNPALITDPGLPAVVAQIREALDAARNAAAAVPAVTPDGTAPPVQPASGPEGVPPEAPPVQAA